MGRIRINKKQIREYAKKAHAPRLAEAASDIETVGDLKAALKGATQAKRDEQGKEALKDLGKGVLADLIPGGGTISSIFDLVKTTRSAPDPRSMLSMLTTKCLPSSTTPSKTLSSKKSQRGSKACPTTRPSATST